MELFYFTVVGIALYFISDWILNRLEDALGRRLEQRSAIFFAILLVLALISFALIRNFVPPS